MKKIKLLLLLLLTFTTSQHLFAQNQDVKWVGIPREKFNYSSSSQKNTNWCWAASLQMVFNYYGVDISQEDIVARSYGTDANGNLPNWAGSFEVITANLNNWNVDKSGKQYQVQAVVYQGAPTPSYMVQELTNQHPILIGYQSGPNSGHAVVITACSYIETPQGPYIQSLVVRDPWPTEENQANRGRVEYDVQKIVDFASHIQAHWYIRIE